MLAFACPTKGRTVVPHASCFFWRSSRKKREEDKGEQPSWPIFFPKEKKSQDEQKRRYPKDFLAKLKKTIPEGFFCERLASFLRSKKDQKDKKDQKEGK
jgi:hypothetical protein